MEEEFETLSVDDPRHPAYFDEEQVDKGFNELADQMEASPDLPPTPPTEEEPDPGFIADNPGQAIGEVAAAIVGGGADAVESVGKVADLTGDTIKTGWNQLFGQPTDEAENPFSENYQAGNWLDIPDDWGPEN